MVLAAGTKEKYNKTEKCTKKNRNIDIEINIETSKTMLFYDRKKTESLCMEQVSDYNYLGTILEESGKIDKQIKKRNGKTGRVQFRKQHVFRKGNNKISVKHIKCIYYTK